MQACILFVKRKFPTVVSGSGNIAPDQIKLPAETLTTLLMCLQTVVSTVTPSSAQEIMQILSNCRMFLTKPNTPTPVSSGNAGMSAIGAMLGSRPSFGLSATPTAMSGAIGTGRQGQQELMGPTPVGPSPGPRVSGQTNEYRHVFGRSTFLF